MDTRAKVLLISPNLKGVKGGINRIQPGLGIGYLGAVLRQSGHEVYIRDTALEGYNNEVDIGRNMVLIGESDEAIEAYISSLQPDIVGISALFSNLMEHAHTIARIAKSVNPAIKVILGGNHISNAVWDYQYALSCSDSGLNARLIDMEDKNIDLCVVGECDFVFPILVEKTINGECCKDIPGLVYCEDGILCINPKTDVCDITNLPFPARDLMNMELYFKIGCFHSGKSRSKRVLNVMASRGCPERCTFCTTPEMWGSNVRWREPIDIYNEIKHGIDVYKISEVQFEDDTLTVNRKKLLEICNLIEPLGIYWCTPNGTKVNYHQSGSKQYEMYQRMSSSGCYQITFACESGVQRVLDHIVNKNLKLREIQPSIENAKKAGLLVHTFWIVGYPGETRDEMEETIEFAAKVEADSYSVAILSPLPGTPVYRKAIKEKRWWNGVYEGGELLYRNSLLKVDGFANQEEFERWVEEKNIYLNSLLKERDERRYKLHYKTDNDIRSLQKQT
jgi:radical SAM superfamily enzyme YgiQ (UPF0313 family)